MNESPSLLGLLGEWKNLGEEEGAGIENGDWAKVAQCQARKTQLQEIITAFRNRAGVDPAPEASQELIRELIAMESRNSECLSRRRENLLAERSRVRSAAGNLRRVRSAYGEPRPQAIWNSYS